MNHQYQSLIVKLKEIFQINRPDLDFGIYRILNARRDEIGEFLDKRLQAKVQTALGEAKTKLDQTAIADLQKEIRDEFGRRAFDENHQLVDEGALSSDLGQKYLALTQQDAKALDDETQVYNHLLTFFSRYYDEGDFISQRRYKGDTYSIPYAGEEVMLHWANKDQYYTKSGEMFSNYRFKLEDEKSVLFRLISADTARENRKDNDKDRRFVIVTEPRTLTRVDDEGEEYEETIEPFSIVDGELTILFEYKAFTSKTKQEELNKQSAEKILSASIIDEQWLKGLKTLEPTEKDPKRTLLDKHLSSYTQKHTADYFIHKDLGGFLSRELDFFIKNEVMHLDDVVSTAQFADIERQLSIIKCLRVIGTEIINFLASLENFQKKLWLKKKFVVGADYCITLDRVDESLYAEIASNEKQWQQWEDLGFKPANSNQKIDGGLFDAVWGEVSYLKQSQFMMVDTSLFDTKFKAKLLQKIDDLDNQVSGLLVNTDNFHGIKLLQEKYTQKISSIYIDPPFNLGTNGDFLYKTDYKDSSWITLLDNRIAESKKLMKEDGYFLLRCDENGNYLVKNLLNTIFKPSNFEAELLVQRIRKNITKQGKVTLPLANDSLFLYRLSESSSFINPYMSLKETRQAYWRRIDDSAGFRNPPERNIFGAVFYPYKKDAHFKYSQKSIDNMILEKRIRLRCKKCKFEHLEGNWSGCPKCGENSAVPQYLVLATDVQILDTNWMDIAGYSHTTGFSTENSEILLDRVLELTTQEKDYVLDYFSGSGTTLSVALEKNRDWIGIEQGDHFYSIIIPRLKQKVYKLSKSVLLKFIKLESYEDTLNNLELVRTSQQQKLFAGTGQEQFDNYLMNYMLEIESKDSLLNVKDFLKPFDYQMNITTDSAGAYERRNVDLVETFNYLIGLEVKLVDYAIERGYVTVEGFLRNGDKTLILWRDCDKYDYDGLDQLLARKLKINPNDNEYKRIYINGDHNIANRYTTQDGQEKQLKIRSIEKEFLTRMFEEA